MKKNNNRKPYRLLHAIDTPADLKKLSIQQLNDLAAEVRQKIIETVSKTGGHLAPNLRAGSRSAPGLQSPATRSGPWTWSGGCWSEVEAGLSVTSRRCSREREGPP